jgi:ClpA/ClpB-like protein
MEGIPEPEIRGALNAHIVRREPNPLPHDLPLSKEARMALVLATEKAEEFSHRYVENKHVLLALVESESSYAAQLLRGQGLVAEKLRPQIKALPQPPEVHRPAGGSETSPESELARRVLEFVHRGEGQSALQLLDHYMAEPGQDRKLRMRLMGGFAAITAAQIGDLKTERHYCEECLAYTPEDPMALYHMADCLARQGETDEARRRAVDCRKAASLQGNEIGRAIVALIEKRFPELKAEL